MPPAESMQKIKAAFDRRFAHWDITLPAGSLAERRPGSIVKAGWTINYQFGTADGMDCLDYFASHRMTNDTLNRIYADGREELLGECQEFYKANDPRAQQAYLEHNRSFYAEVKRRGLD